MPLAYPVITVSGVRSWCPASATNWRISASAWLRFAKACMVWSTAALYARASSAVSPLSPSRTETFVKAPLPKRLSAAVVLTSGSSVFAATTTAMRHEAVNTTAASTVTKSANRSKVPARLRGSTKMIALPPGKAVTTGLICTARRCSKTDVRRGRSNRANLGIA